MSDLGPVISARTEFDKLIDQKLAQIQRRIDQARRELATADELARLEHLRRVTTRLRDPARR
jgi:hypothetical protein